MTFSRPMKSAKRMRRCATSSGCSTSTDELVMTPGMSTVPSGILASFHTAHSCSWRGLDASNECAGADLHQDIDDVLDLEVVHARPHVDAVAGVVADLLGR